MTIIHMINHKLDYSEIDLTCINGIGNVDWHEVLPKILDSFKPEEYGLTVIKSERYAGLYTEIIVRLSFKTDTVDNNRKLVFWGRMKEVCHEVITYK